MILIDLVMCTQMYSCPYSCNLIEYYKLQIFGYCVRRAEVLYETQELIRIEELFGFESTDSSMKQKFRCLQEETAELMSKCV